MHVKKQTLQQQSHLQRQRLQLALKLKLQLVHQLLKQAQILAVAITPAAMHLQRNLQSKTVSDNGAWLVVGLGNPGPTYASTRHNIGAMVIDELVSQNSEKLTRHKRALADVCETRIGGAQVVLVKPLSYMNESGGPVKALAKFYKVDPEQIIVLHDELDIPLAAIRVKLGGGDNGHNGLKSIRSAMGSGDWFRVRLGIGRPPGQQDPADFVLRNFGSSESAEVEILKSQGCEAVSALITKGLIETQNLYNS
jgi:PTH1 family peptidyl-tRNA hydrolase